MDPLTNARVSMVVKVPRRLVKWWNMFTLFEQYDLRGKLGTLISLMDITPRPDLVEAMLTFWNPQGMVFKFGDLEMTPTLDEIAGLTCLPYLDKDLIYTRAHSSTKFLKIIGMDLETRMGCLDQSWVPLDFLFERFARPTGYETFIDEFSISYDSWKKRRPMVFAIALLGLMVFPLEGGHISMRLGSIDFEFFHDKHSGKVTVVPTILAEIYRALTRIREGGRFFEGSNLLLQLWMIEHLHPATMFEKDVIDRCLRDRMKCIEHRMTFDKFALPLGVQDWVDYLGSLTEEKILWSYLWIDLDVILAGSRMQDFLVLIGLWCTRPYTPARVMRQLGRRQEVPYILDSRDFIKEFDTMLHMEVDI
uniref:Uncharacterized protein LOC104227856 n=1 Tax=Nicotiana sylvestris TaxID=4096 RepID=A0A1U7WV05_NICSY|nr:PREDICTED: uncharacterized protein LOC104227856 [Nicotiana sylvestris]XP_009778515.1 PREDICTED: uncharacterized protein LOC104227856 [Nicotiana sylvestris]